MRERYNFKLIIGSLLFLCFIVISLFGPLIAPYEKGYKEKIEYFLTDEGGVLRAPPFPPSKDHILGTDKWGSDILSLLLYGAKYTVFGSICVALIRLIIGGFFGIYHALEGREPRKKPKFTILSGIPTFILIYFIMIGINIQSSLDTLTLILIQCCLMVILGVPGVYNTIFALTTEVRKNLFIIASESFGGNRIHILKSHIYPTIKGNLIIILINEVILVLNIIGQLSIFNIFFGGTERQVSPTIFLSITNEWAGLIGQSRAVISTTSKWIVINPLVFYLLFLFTLYLLSIGLKEAQRNTYRKDVML